MASIVSDSISLAVRAGLAALRAVARRVRRGAPASIKGRKAARAAAASWARLVGAEVVASSIAWMMRA